MSDQLPDGQRPVSRSANESHLYMDLRPCPCGGAGHEQREQSLHLHGELFVSVYRFACPGCGRDRSFEFDMPGEPPHPDVYGAGDAPSEIIDAGEFLWAATRYGDLARQRAFSGDPAQLRTVAPLLRACVELFREARKFVPAGESAVPAGTVRSPLGRQVLALDPEGFTAERIDARIEVHRKLLDSYAQ